MEIQPKSNIYYDIESYCLWAKTVIKSQCLLTVREEHLILTLMEKSLPPIHNLDFG